MKITITTPEIKDLEKRLAEETDRAEAWEKRCEELEQDLRELRDRIGAQNWTIAEYDDENRRLKERLDKAKKNALETEFPAPFETSLTSLNDWARRIHEIAVKHGWWAQPPMAAANSRAGRENAENGASPEAGADRFADDDKPFPEIVALCHSELSEALEEYRYGHSLEWRGEDGKPEGIAVEMIDCMIRILDWCGHEGIDVDTLMEKKVMYNKKRPYRHGGKKA